METRRLLGWMALAPAPPGSCGRFPAVRVHQNGAPSLTNASPRNSHKRLVLLSQMLFLRARRIEQQWQYRLYCRTLSTQQRNLLNGCRQRATHDTQAGAPPVGEAPQEDEVLSAGDDDLSFRLSGEQWKDFPKDLEWKTFLLEWHVSATKIQKLPDYLASFSLLRVLELAKNKLTRLTADIGKLHQLRQLNISYNRLSCVPAQLGMCRKLERLQVAGNRNLSELPFELSSLKRLAHLDIAENRFASIPVCALRMSALRLLDLSHNRLSDLPQDMDRLTELVTLLVHKNRLSYLPDCLTNIASLQMIVVSGDHLVCVPTKLCSNPSIKFIRLYDNQAKEKTTDVPRTTRRGREDEDDEDDEDEPKDGRDKEFMDAYVSTLKDREDMPFSTTKVTISCLL
ncbi:leucine-rich repeat-containing protein 2 isoform X2 [Vanacampus margaritifer]